MITNDVATQSFLNSIPVYTEVTQVVSGTANHLDLEIGVKTIPLNISANNLRANMIVHTDASIQQYYHKARVVAAATRMFKTSVNEN